MNSRKKSFHLGYRPGLDGLRGVAIILVLLNHGLILGNGFGFVAVNTFFVLSGFLITWLLVAEYDQSNAIRLWQFYLRRALRLLPALTAMLVVFVIFSFATDPHKRAVREFYEALAAFFYFSNWGGIFQIGRHIALAHTWSLSVEEQFYIVWPGVLLLLLRKTDRASLLCWIFMAAFLSVIVRISLWMLDTTNLSGNIFPVNPHRLMAGTDARADSLLLGCFAGVLVSTNLLPQKIWFSAWLKIAAAFSGIALMVMGAQWEMSSRMVCFGWFAESIFAAVLVLYLASVTNDRLPFFLKNRALVYVGQISYGIYLWHFPILKFMEQHHLPWRNMGYLVAVIPIVLMSYYLIEKPCLKFKKRFQLIG